MDLAGVALHVRNMQSHARARSIAHSSAKTYCPAAAQYLAWCEKFYPTIALPSDPVDASMVVGDFAIFLWEFGFNPKGTGNKANTVKSKISALSY